MSIHTTISTPGNSDVSTSITTPDIDYPERRGVPTTPPKSQRKAVGREDHKDYKSTPHVIRISSAPRSDESLTTNMMKNILKYELRNSIFTGLPGIPEALCPKSSLPITLNDHFLSRFPMYDSKNKKWKGFPFDDTSIQNNKIEHSFALFLNNISRLLVKCCASNNGITPRSWSADFCSHSMPGRGPKRKPDLILIDSSYNTESISWGNVLCVGEVTRSKQLTSRIKETIASKSYSIFQGQEDRRFAISIAFCDRTIFLIMFDRAGGLFSQAYNIENDPCTFLYIVASMIFGTRTNMGFDPTLFVADKARQIQVINTYTIRRTIFKSAVIRGRGTTCWKVERDGNFYVVKDLWLDNVRSESDTSQEELILKRLEGVEGIPRVVESKEVMIDGQLDTTDVRRQMFKQIKDTTNPAYQRFLELENRIHFRMVMEPLANPIWDFSSKRELISVLIDIVKSVYQFN
jgi:hypothetical protein